MKGFFLLFFSFTLTYATTITSHNIYKQDGAIDLMLSFDKPYLGKISKKEDENSTILMLGGLSLEKSITKKIDSNIINQIQILPYKEQIFIKVDTNTPYSLEASKTIDNFGLRIRVKPKLSPTLGIKTKVYETRDETDISGSFIKVMAVLAFLFLLLYILKRWIQNKDQPTNSWLFQKDEKQNIKVLTQKVLDRQNRAVLLEFNGKKYFVILGNSNILLDKFEHTQTDDDTQFEQMLEEKSVRLDDILNCS